MNVRVPAACAAVPLKRVHQSIGLCWALRLPPATFAGTDAGSKMVELIDKSDAGSYLCGSPFSNPGIIPLSHLAAGSMLIISSQSPVGDSLNAGGFGPGNMTSPSTAAWGQVEYAES